MIEEPAKLTLIRDFPRPSSAQVAALQNVQTSFICDALGGYGAMSPQIASLAPDIMCTRPLAGPALVAENGPADILGTLAAVEMLSKGDIVVASAQGHQGCAAAGDQVAGMLKNAGAAGLVTDGPMRDYDGILATHLPCWCTGLTPNSPFVTGPATTGGTTRIGGLQVASGDMIVADRDGVVVIPFARIDDVITQLDAIRAAEAELEAKVKAGFCTPLDLDAMLADGSAVNRP